MPRKPVPIQRSLLLNITLLILLLGGMLVGVMVYTSTRQVESLSRVIVQRTLTQTHIELARFFRPVINSIALGYHWSTHGLLNLQDGAQLRDKLTPVIVQFPQISSLLVADDTGNEFMLLYHKNEWRMRQIGMGLAAGKARITQWQDGQSARTSVQKLDYDSRQRPWFKGALDMYNILQASDNPVTEDLLHWTQPYTFYTTGDPGITASIAHKDKRGRMHVLAIDIALNDISEFTTAMHVSPNGFVFVMTEDGKILGLPGLEKFKQAGARGEYLLKLPSQLDAPVLRDATAEYMSRSNRQETPFSFKSQNQKWWVGTVDYQLASDYKLIIGVLVPEQDVVGNLNWINLSVILLMGLTALVTLLRIWHLASRYSRPIKKLVADSYQISQGDLQDPAEIRSNVLEVQQLAQAHNDMRSGLRDLLKMERDMQLAREIQRNTLPDALPELSGYQLANWYVPADETGGDSYDVIGVKPSRSGRRLVYSRENIQHALFMLADASGHGIGPALTVTQVRAMLRMALRIGSDLCSIIEHLNRQLCMDLHSGRFITLWLGLLDVRANTLVSYSAGQAPLLYFSHQAQSVEWLDADGPPLGISEDLPAIQPRTYTLEGGDIFMVMSDGIFEATSQSGAAYGLDRIKAIVQTHQHVSAQQMLNIILDSLTTFTHAAAPKDDQTILIIKRTL